MISATAETLRIPCSFPKPPILKNTSFKSWQPRYLAMRRITDEAIIIGKANRRIAVKAGWTVPITTPVNVLLVWTVGDQRRRDASGPQPTLECWIDGLVRGGLLAEDHHRIVRRAACTIRVDPGKGGVHVEITHADP